MPGEDQLQIHQTLVLLRTHRLQALQLALHRQEGSQDAHAPPGQPPMGFMIPGPLPPGALPGIPAGMPAGFMAIPSLPGADPFLPCQSRHLIGQRAQARANHAAGQGQVCARRPFPSSV